MPIAVELKDTLNTGQLRIEDVEITSGMDTWRGQPPCNGQNGWANIFPYLEGPLYFILLADL